MCRNKHKDVNRDVNITTFVSDSGQIKHNTFEAAVYKGKLTE